MRVFLACLLMSVAVPVSAQTTTAEDVARQVLDSGEAGSSDVSQTSATDAAAPVAEAIATSLPAPNVQFELEQTDVIPGQAVSLRITVLVPTWLSKPVEFPTYDIANVITRLSEGATSPTSKRIDGETWSGVTRRYRFIPMIEGRFTLPAEELVVRYADPDAPDPVEVRLPTETIRFSAVRPAGTENLSPFIAAENLTLTQEITGDPSTLVQGGSFGRNVLAKIEGTTPILLPQLMPETAIPGLSAYAKEPVLVENDNRGTLSGTRSEEITYVAEGGLSAELPKVTLDWYDLSSHAVKTATVEAIAVQVSGPAFTVDTPPNPMRYAALIAVACVLGALATAYLKWGLPALRQQRAKRRNAYLVSDQYALAQLRASVAKNDLAGALTALKGWQVFVGAQITAPVQAALLAVGQAQYAATSPARADPVWPEVKRTLDNAQRAAHSAQNHLRLAPALPDLNPKART